MIQHCLALTLRSWRSRLIGVFGLLVLLALTSCSANRAGAMPTASYHRQMEYAPAAEAPAGGAQPAQAAPAPDFADAKVSGGLDVATKDAAKSPPPSPPTTPGPPPTTPTSKSPTPTLAGDSPLQQMLIYAARLALGVSEVDKSLAQVEAIARQVGGLLSQRTDRQIVIRVPTAKFFEVLKQIEGLGDVLHKDIQVEDVSEEFRDLSLRLKNAREVRERLAALLANAKTVEESLRVERELARLSDEIERLEGRLKYLRDRAAYSTITIAFEPLQVEDLKRQKLFRLPFPWLSELGLGRLLQLH